MGKKSGKKITSKLEGRVESAPISAEELKTVDRQAGDRQGAGGAPPEYVLLTRREPTDENDEIMRKAVDMDGHIKLRINPQIYEGGKAQRYVGLLGQQFRLKVNSPEAVMKIMDAIDRVLEEGTAV